MAKGRSGAGHTGVQIRDSGSVRIRVRFGGKWVWESVPYPSSAAGLRQAAKHRQNVLDRDRIGAVDWSEWFPESSRCRRVRGTEPARVEPTFTEVADAWRRHSGLHLKPSTLRGYRKRVDGIWKPAFGQRRVSTIIHSDVLDLVAANGWRNGKTQENALSVAKSIFESAKRDGWITINPAEGVRTRRSKKAPPDPLSSEEVAAVLGWLEGQRSPWWPYFAVAFGTGMRPSELGALRWGDIDWVGGSVDVSRGVVDKIVGSTKSDNGERQIPMLPLARAGLSAQKAVTFRSMDEVFTQPATGAALQDEQPAYRAWRKALKEAGVRHRRAYSTRHTFATRLIMHGVRFVQVSKWLGHGNPAVTLSAYTTWIEEETSGDLKPEEVWPHPFRSPRKTRGQAARTPPRQA